MKILLAEDDAASAKALKILLSKAGHTVIVGDDGAAAFEFYEQQDFDVLITDWMMPRMDGIELIHRVRKFDRADPIVVMLTALTSIDARAHAMRAGADEYLTKPCDPRVVLKQLETLVARHAQPLPDAAELSESDRHTVPRSGSHRPSPRTPGDVARAAHSLPPFAGVLMAASTGGPTVLHQVVRSLTPDLPAAYFLVQHGPAWMMEALCDSMQRETSLTVCVAEEGMEIRPGVVHVAAGDHHLEIEPQGLRLHLTQDPPVNYVRPAADPLLRTGAATFGRHALAVILTGMGRDGAAGARDVVAAGGTVLAQDPASTVAPSMPKTVIDLGLVTHVVPPDSLVERITHEVGAMDLHPGGPSNRA